METPKRTFHIRYAEPADVDALIRLRKHAEQWLHAAGIEQWTDPDRGEQDIRAQLDRGTTYAVTTAAGDTVGCLTLDDADLDFWTPLEASEPALYLYKFILGYDRRGIGLGDVLLDWAAEHADKAGARWLRLDCWRTNDKLHRYYLDRGFQQVDVRTAEDRNSGALFQRPTNLRMLAGQRAPVELVDMTKLAGPPSLPSYDRYDPTGEALVWWNASKVLTEMAKEPEPEGVCNPWRTALEQAATVLGVRSREIRRANGSYYRVMDGTGQ